MPVRSTLVADPGVSVGATLREAYRTLAQYYVDPLDPRSVFQAAVDSVERALQSRGVHAPDVQIPPLPGSSEADWEVFSSSYRSLAELAPAVPTRQQELGHAAVRGMAASVQEGHTVFLTPREYEDLQAWQRGDLSYAGIGVRLSGNPPMIFEVFPDSPAQRAGLQYGDIITTAAGKSASELRLDELVAVLRGDAGTPVPMTVLHPDGSREDVTGQDPIGLRQG
jgi:C-terminal processing protease CtpA/Prc